MSSEKKRKKKEKKSILSLQPPVAVLSLQGSRRQEKKKSLFSSRFENALYLPPSRMLCLLMRPSAAPPPLEKCICTSAWVCMLWEERIHRHTQIKAMHVHIKMKVHFIPPHPQLVCSSTRDPPGGSLFPLPHLTALPSCCAHPNANICSKLSEPGAERKTLEKKERKSNLGRYLKYHQIHTYIYFLLHLSNSC